MANETALTVEFWPSDGPQVVYCDGKTAYHLTQDSALAATEHTIPYSRRDLAIMHALLTLAAAKVEEVIAAQEAGR